MHNWKQVKSLRSGRDHAISKEKLQPTCADPGRELEQSLLQAVFAEVLLQTSASVAVEGILPAWKTIPSHWSAMRGTLRADRVRGRQGDAKGLSLHLRVRDRNDRPEHACFNGGKDLQRVALLDTLAKGQPT